VYLSSMHCATSEADSGSSFQFSPTTRPIAPPKPRDVPNRSPNGDRLDILDVSDNLELHPFPYATKSIPGLTLRLRSGGARALASGCEDLGFLGLSTCVCRPAHYLCRKVDELFSSREIKHTVGKLCCIKAYRLSADLIFLFTLNLTKGAEMANPKQIVQPSDLPVRKSYSQVGAVTGGTLVFIATHALSTL
jgi:hypothetical protein